jgi:hypothetical protein
MLSEDLPMEDFELTAAFEKLRTAIFEMYAMKLKVAREAAEAYWENPARFNRGHDRLAHLACHHLPKRQRAIQKAYAYRRADPA